MVCSVALALHEPTIFSSAAMGTGVTGMQAANSKTQPAIPRTDSANLRLLFMTTLLYIDGRALRFDLIVADDRH
jgi:hypothetical protein